MSKQPNLIIYGPNNCKKRELLCKCLQLSYSGKKFSSGISGIKFSVYDKHKTLTIPIHVIDSSIPFQIVSKYLDKASAIIFCYNSGLPLTIETFSSFHKILKYLSPESHFPTMCIGYSAESIHSENEKKFKSLCKEHGIGDILHSSLSLHDTCNIAVFEPIIRSIIHKVLAEESFSFDLDHCFCDPLYLVSPRMSCSFIHCENVENDQFDDIISMYRSCKHSKCSRSSLMTEDYFLVRHVSIGMQFLEKTSKSPLHHIKGIYVHGKHLIFDEIMDKNPDFKDFEELTFPLFPLSFAYVFIYSVHSAKSLVNAIKIMREFVKRPKMFKASFHLLGIQNFGISNVNMYAELFCNSFNNPQCHVSHEMINISSVDQMVPFFEKIVQYNFSQDNAVDLKDLNRLMKSDTSDFEEAKSSPLPIIPPLPSPSTKCLKSIPELHILHDTTEDHRKFLLSSQEALSKYIQHRGCSIPSLIISPQVPLVAWGTLPTLLDSYLPYLDEHTCHIPSSNIEAFTTHPLDSDIFLPYKSSYLEKYSPHYIPLDHPIDISFHSQGNPATCTVDFICVTFSCLQKLEEKYQIQKSSNVVVFCYDEQKKVCSETIFAIKNIVSGFCSTFLFPLHTDSEKKIHHIRLEFYSFSSNILLRNICMFYKDQLPQSSAISVPEGIDSKFDVSFPFLQTFNSTIDDQARKLLQNKRKIMELQTMIVQARKQIDALKKECSGLESRFPSREEKEKTIIQKEVKLLEKKLLEKMYQK
ncbi:hypothetical protein ADUPG1_009192 [Aduncisulcus paluster]|uniref:Uncharacterized protein n=1 Tax=Aduncisulcus paluster TaxID=2918883 RepID=A0ABQ5KUT4_9EUKA|nr:hypothetical protein ADUPG1_009192 [Aduncisulcus paluster]